MYMCNVYGCLNILVPVLLYLLHVRVAIFCMCVLKGYSEKVKK